MSMNREKERKAAAQRNKSDRLSWEGVAPGDAPACLVAPAPCLPPPYLPPACLRPVARADGLARSPSIALPRAVSWAIARGSTVGNRCVRQRRQRLELGEPAKQLAADDHEPVQLCCATQRTRPFKQRGRRRSNGSKYFPRRLSRYLLSYCRRSNRHSQHTTDHPASILLALCMHPRSRSHLCACTSLDCCCCCSAITITYRPLIALSV